MTKKQNIISICILFSIIAAVIFWLSNNVVWVIDDYWYQFVFKFEENCMDSWAHNPLRIRTFWDVLQSQYVHYFMMNGRFVAHCIVQSFVGIIGKNIFSLVNACIYIALFYLILKSATILNPPILKEICLNAER